MSDNDTNVQGDPALGDAGKAAIAAERKRADEAEKAVKALQAEKAALENAGKSDLEKALAKISELEAANTTLTAEVGTKDLTILRLNTGITEGLPANLIARLQGTDEETFKADAASLKELVPDTKSDPFPKADPSQGSKGQTGKTTTADAFASFAEGKL